MNKLLKINFSLYAGILFVTLLLLLSFFGPMLAPHTLTDPLETHYSNGKIFAPPLEPFQSKEYPLGTDKWGYDLLSIILYGIRYTIFIPIIITIIKMVMGTIIGIYFGVWKKTPGWIIAFETAWSYVPLFLVLYFFLQPITFNSQLPPKTLIFYFIMLTSIISIPSIVSSVRLKSQEVYQSVFIEASRTLGAGTNRIVWLHIFPQLKESLLVMFILEIVYVMTIMGQLALMNIFIGGTYVTYDPLIYHSITKEIAGLVGQARSNIYGNQYILVVPLLILLFATVSFNLLANGLKKSLQTEYKKTPWIKTTSHLFKPKRGNRG
ncbi:ABC transporter permease subunit [Neobacillus sp. LXY-4]|uniref:ABC transporter permease subunit n=1 Tax=Neobacillus sp. LXY-4 TaxID=3379826 RepID=UPI003EE08BF3